MSLNSYNANASDYFDDRMPRRRSDHDKPLVLLVKDQEDTLFEMKQVLELSGYRVIDTDNGQETRSSAPSIHTQTSSSSIWVCRCSTSWLPRARS